MRVMVLAPGIKSGAAEKMLSETGIDQFYLTNPLYQERLAKDISAKRLLRDDDLSDDSVALEGLTDKGLGYAANWSRQDGLGSRLFYRDIALGDMVSLQFGKYLVSVLRPLFFYERLLARTRASEIVLANDGGVWSEALIFFCREKGVPLKVMGPMVHCKPSPSSVVPSSWLRGALDRFNTFSSSHIRKGGILFSSAPHYSLPLLKRSRRNYFLRPEFSEKAFLQGMRYSFNHLTPEYFVKSSLSRVAKLDLDGFFQDADKYFTANAFFLEAGLNFWALIREHVRQRVIPEIEKTVTLVDCFEALLLQLSPRAVVVEEEVNTFNKTLVACAKKAGIRTFCLLHSALIRKTVSVPSHVHRILAWGPSTRSRLVQWGVSPERIAEAGAPQFDHFRSIDRDAVRKTILKKLSVPEDAYVVSLALSDVLTNESVIWKYPRASVFQDILEKSLRISLSFVSEHPHVYLLIKAHPRYKHTWLVQELLGRFDEPTRSRTRLVTDSSSADVISASDLVLTTGSTVYFEAVLLGRRSMVFDYADRRYCAFISDDFLDLNNAVTSLQSLRDVMQKGGEVFPDELGRHFVDLGSNSVDRVLNEVQAMKGK